MYGRFFTVAVMIVCLRRLSCAEDASVCVFMASRLGSTSRTHAILFFGVTTIGTGLDLGGLRQVLEESPVRIRQEATLEGHTDDTGNLAFSPDSKLFVSSSKDGTVRIWDIGERQQRYVLSGFESLGDLLPARCPEPTADLSWSPDGSRLAVAAPLGSIHLCDATGKPMRTIESVARRTRKVLFSPDGQRLLASFDNGHLCV